jgi:hypothetical protein
MTAAYASCMFDVGESLMTALQSGGARLGGAASATARSQTPYGSSRSDAFMAQSVREAIFTEALLNAVHSRLAELKVASR